MVSYIIRSLGEDLIHRTDDIFSSCNSGIHEEVYDPANGETVCGKCGLVLSELCIESSVAGFGRLSRRKVFRETLRPRTRVTTKQRVTTSKVQNTLSKLLKESNASKQVKDKTFEIYGVLRGQGVSNGYSASTMVLALIYSAHRLCRVPFAFSNFPSFSGKDRRKIMRCYRQICGKLQLIVPKLEEKSYLSYLVESMQISRDAEILAAEILDKATNQHLLRGANPRGTAATALYIACNMLCLKVTQDKIAKIAGISEVTIRTDLKILKRVNVLT